MGAGKFEDFPINGYGDTDCSRSDPLDQPFTLQQTITSVISLVEAGVGGYSVTIQDINGDDIEAPVGCGADGPESNIEALYQVATGEGLGMVRRRLAWQVTLPESGG